MKTLRNTKKSFLENECIRNSGYPVRDRMLVEKIYPHPYGLSRQGQDICRKNVAYLTVRPLSRKQLFSTHILSITVLFI